jgi:hypothetical protein
MQINVIQESRSLYLLEPSNYMYTVLYETKFIDLNLNFVMLFSRN